MTQMVGLILVSLFIYGLIGNRVAEILTEGYKVQGRQPSDSICGLAAVFWPLFLLAWALWLLVRWLLSPPNPPKGVA